MSYSMRQVLVTGAAGFIGSNFVQYLLGQSETIRIISLDKLTYAGNKDNLAPVLSHPRHHFIEGDITDALLVASILEQYTIDTLVHFAAESHVDNSIKNPQVFLETNVLGTFRLLEAARAYWLGKQGWDATQCRFHHISTDEVYGSLRPEDSPFSEQHAYQPNSPYAASKAASDHLVRAYFHTYGLPVTTSNCSNNFGPYQHPEKFIPTVINACLNQKPIPVYGNGSNIRDWLYVEDHCEAIDHIIRRGTLGEVYNIGGNNEFNNITLVHCICDMMDKLRPMHAPHAKLITFVIDRLGHDWRYAIDNRKIGHALGWSPQGDFHTKLQETIVFYLRGQAAD